MGGSTVNTATENNEVTILDRLIQPNRHDLSPEAAQSLLRLSFGPQDRARMGELSVKSQQGALSAVEVQELRSYVVVGHMLALLQSKARQSLKRSKDNP
jgi:hypothetical protein